MPIGGSNAARGGNVIAKSTRASIGMAAAALAALALLGASATTETAAPAAAGEPAAARIQTLDVTGIDTSAQACEDFYQYGIGALARPPTRSPRTARAGEPSTSCGSATRTSCTSILERLAADKSAPAGLRRAQARRLLRRLHGRGVDRAKRAGADRARARPDRSDRERAGLSEEIGRLQPMGVNALFAFGSEEDRKDSSRVIAAALQGGLGLPERDYYAEDRREVRAAARPVRRARHEDAGALGRAVRRRPRRARRRSWRSRRGWPRRRRTPSTSAIRTRRYHPMTLAAFSKETPNLSWTAYFREQDVPASPRRSTSGSPTSSRRPTRSPPPSRCRPGRRTCAGGSLTAAAPALPKTFVDENFAFYGKTLSGMPEIQPRWKRCVTATDDALGMALGRIYVQEYFPPEAKKRADELVQQSPARARRRPADARLDERRRPRRRRSPKVATFTPKIGYPDKLARLLDAADHTRLARRQRPGRQPVRVEARPREDRQARGPGRLGHVAAHGQRLLQRRQERDRLPRRDPPAALLLPGGRRRHQLRRDRRGHRARDHPRLRQLGPQVRREGQPGRLVDRGGRASASTSAPSASSSSTTATSSRRTSTRTGSSCRARRSRTWAA